jgi:hypothetical protein
MDINFGTPEQRAPESSAKTAAVDGGRYTCAGCKKDYNNARDAVACCGNAPEVFSPRTPPLAEAYPNNPGEDKGLGQAKGRQEAERNEDRKTIR